MRKISCHEWYFSFSFCEMSESGMAEKRLFLFQPPWWTLALKNQGKRHRRCMVPTKPWVTGYPHDQGPGGKVLHRRHWTPVFHACTRCMLLQENGQFRTPAIGTFCCGWLWYCSFLVKVCQSIRGFYAPWSGCAPKWSFENVSVLREYTRVWYFLCRSPGWLPWRQ